jgi:hypothetical protein
MLRHVLAVPDWFARGIWMKELTGSSAWAGLVREVAYHPPVRFRPSRALPAGAAVLILAAAAWGGVSWFRSRDASPSCSWPARISGTGTPQQDGLVRCYLEALATRSTQEMGAVAQSIPPAHITTGLFAYSPDARAGVASVNLKPSPVDDTFVLVTIRYADGVTEGTGLLNMTAMGGPSTWRMAIGQPGQLPGQ